MYKKQPTSDLAHKSSIGHWVRVAVMLLSGGFIYPHVMTENDAIGIKPDVIGNAATVKN
jgi:hypothetical protein